MLQAEMVEQLMIHRGMDFAEASQVVHQMEIKNHHFHIDEATIIAHVLLGDGNTTPNYYGLSSQPPPQ